MKETHNTLGQDEVADITLLLEGTYPFVRGGVSSWVHQIILGLSEHTFSLIFIGGSKEHYGPIKYTLPKNVVHLECHYIMEPWQDKKPKARIVKPEYFDDITRLHDYFRKIGASMPDGLIKHVVDIFGKEQGITQDDFLFSKAAWDMICNRYTRFCTDPSFVDFFWTIRTMHVPLFKLAEVARKLPRSHVFHSVSTGYAGFLGMLLHKIHNKPFILTEHGIYTKERKIDLAQADWIKDSWEVFGKELESNVSYIRRLWIRLFEGLGRLIYEEANPIIAICEVNHQRQIKDGANPSRTCVIHNAIDLDRFTPLRAKRPKKIPPVLGLIGRVVPIKDVKTFIRSMRMVCSRLPDSEGWIVGPTDEDEDYYRECKDLVTNFDLEERVKFLGFQNVEDVLPRLGLLVLTSISEALPLSILEGFASGLPAISTNVGACREIIEGGGAEDCSLGAAGAIVPMADAETTAKEAVDLLTNSKRWHKAQKTAIERVERYYNQEQLFVSYRKIYRQALGGI